MGEQLRNRSSTALRSKDVVQSSSIVDAGNLASSHYKSKLSPLRYKIRSVFLPLIIKETEILDKMQRKIRNPILDFYFAWSANLASHTFYVLMLPAPAWLGASTLLRDLVYVLGFGIYLTGNLKDFLCLPRPRSPPLHRITMSSYTTQEYGVPSSHSANAVAVTLVILWKLLEYRNEFNTNFVIGGFIFLILYCFSLVFGRIYCGMHGFLDVLTGAAIGILCFSFRFFLGEAWDNWLLSSHNDTFFGIISTPIMIVGGYVLLIHIHFEPADDCPCFDDSVAFVGVLIGLDLSHWFCILTQHLVDKNPYGDPLLIYFDTRDSKYLNGFLRILLGVLLVAIWKTISKPIIFTILPPVYKYIGIYLPRRNYSSTAFSSEPTRKIRSQSLSNISEGSLANLNKFIKGVTDHEKKDRQGPETEIDYYAMLESEKMTNLKVPQVFRPRYDVEIVGRLIVYAGISVTAIWGFTIGTEILHL